LPLPKPVEKETILIRSRAARSTLTGVAGSRLEQLTQNISAIAAPKSLKNLHPLVKQTAEISELCQVDEVGFIVAEDLRFKHIRVLRKSLHRALRLLDGMVKELLACYFEVLLNQVGFKVDNVNVKLSVPKWLIKKRCF